MKKEWDRFTCFTHNGEMIYQEMRPYMNKTKTIPWDEIFRDWERKPRSVHYSRFFKYLPEKVQKYLTIQPEETKARVKGIKRLLEKHTLKEIHAILSEESHFNRTPQELGILLQAKEAIYPAKMKESHTPAILLDYETNMDSYDKLYASLNRGVF